ncbi:MAG: FmdB family zinc ribbon protein [Acidobacteriota bacterium]
MPIYEYECRKCGKRFEKIQSFSDKPINKCNDCGGPAHRVISVPAIQFKGTGWYVTDYARKGKLSEKKEESAESRESPAREKESKAAAGN